MMRAKLLLAGYYGCGNLGDDAVLLGLLSGLNGKNVDVTVLTGAPEETNRLYGVNVVQRKDFAQINRAIETCDALVFGGGSIFQDVTSVRSVAYYAKLVQMAKKAGKKVVMLAQGVGPLNSFFGKRLAAGAFGAADAICVRDTGSVSTLRSLGVKMNPRLTADLALLLEKPPASEESLGFAVGNMKTIGLAPRAIHEKGNNVVQTFGDLARLLFKTGLMPVLIEMDRTEDGPLIVEIGKSQGGKVPDIRKLASPMQAQQRLARMDAVIAMRLHAGILAVTVDVPPFMIGYDPKVAGFCSGFDLPTPPPAQGMNAQKLFDSFMGFYKDRDRHLRTIQRKKEEQVKLARQNIEVLLDVVRA